MKTKLFLVMCVLMFGFTSVAGQTAKDVETKYGQLEKVYSVSELLWMTPAYGADGQLCMMRLYPKRISVSSNYFDDKLDLDQVLKFINELIPIEARGARKDSFGTSDLGGGIVWTTFNYDHLRLVFISTFALEKPPERLPDRPDELLDFQIDEKAFAELRRKEAMQSDDELIRKHASSAKLLEIYWPGRKCVEP